MATESSNKRSTPRAQYFLVHQAAEYCPVFVFRSESDPDAIAALVTDMGEGGVQILSTPSADIENKRFRLELLSGLPEDAVKLHTCEVDWIWSHPDGMYVKSGFSFSETAAPIPDLLDRLAASEHHMLRCLLHPVSA